MGFGGSLLERKHPNEPLNMRSVFNIVPDFDYEPRCVFSFWRQSGFSLASHMLNHQKTPPPWHPNHQPHITLLQFRHRSTPIPSASFVSAPPAVPHKPIPNTLHESSVRRCPSSITLTNTFMKHRGGRRGSRSMHHDHGYFTAYSPHPTWSWDDEFVQPSLSLSSEASYQSSHHKRSNKRRGDWVWRQRQN